MEHSTSEAIIVSMLNRSSNEISYHSERNKTLLLLKMLPIYVKLLISMFMVIFVNFLFTFVQFYIRKNPSLKDIDIYSFCCFYGIVPPFLIFSLGILIEGKISELPSLT